MLAEDLGMPFIEPSREVEKVAGGRIGEIQALYGQGAYRRNERRALDDTLAQHPQAVIALPGGIVASWHRGIVAEPATYNEVLSKCSTVWLKASAEDHMQRVAAQGDLRPMAASTEAMAELKTILAGRAAFHSKASLHLDTSAQPLAETYIALRSLVRTLLHCCVVKIASNPPPPFRSPPMTLLARVDYQTHPSQYKHWKLKFEGQVATLSADFDENAGRRPGYKLKLNSHDLGVDVELNDAINHVRFEHPEVRTVVRTCAKEKVFCSGANIFMLGVSSHAWKVNFRKFTNKSAMAWKTPPRTAA